MFRLAVVASLIASSGWAAERPRLGVLVVIDQLSLDAFDARVSKLNGGIKRMISEGVRFRECRYEAAPTITSVGHSTLVTGTYGEVHGIVANEWVDHATGLPVLSTEDPAYQVLGRPSARDGTAPTMLRAPTLGDSVKLFDPRAKVVTISGKDRSAILTAGRSADAAVWFDSLLPIFTTSTFYAKEIPSWVTSTNAELSKLMLSGAFAWGLPGGGITGKNPEPVHRAGDSELLAERAELQPILDRLEVDLALSAVTSLELGKDDAPDLLVVSFSGHDRTGHRFGPDSADALAEYAVIDLEIGRLLAGLDAKVGKDKYVVALTADHGMAPLPELAKTRRLDAGRIDVIALKAALEQEANAALGKGEWFSLFKYPGFYVSTVSRAKIHAIDERLRAVARKQPGILDLLPLPSVMNGSYGGQFAQLYRTGAFDERSPDFIVVTRPYWISGAEAQGSHGSAYLYDREVPLLFFGGGLKKFAAGSAEAVDVAPTLSKLLSIPPPAASRGHALDLQPR